MASHLLLKNAQRPIQQLRILFKNNFGALKISDCYRSLGVSPFKNQLKPEKSRLPFHSSFQFLVFKKAFSSAPSSSTFALHDEPRKQDFTSTQDLGSKIKSQESAQASKPIVAYWYFASAFLVFGIVILGGVTRLTESGLSIVEWNLIKGMKPPSNEQEWIEEFEKYKAFPEYQLLNQNMTLAEFKRIFYFEWAHRMWGRAIGLFFLVPFAYFASRPGFMSSNIKKRSLLISAMIGTQGLFGWLMVKSGLDQEIVQRKDVPRVNHFWLSAHLGSAFLIYSAMLATGLEIWKQNRLIGKVQKTLQISKSFKRLSAVVVGLIFVTAISGAWVAGLDAGLIYNEFPFMGDGLVPSDMWAYSNPELSKDGDNGTDNSGKPRMSWIENLARNPSAVQFNHRLLAVSTFTAISALWIISRRVSLPSTSRLATSALLGTAMIQVALGISTLLFFVPVPLAAAHQTGSLSLLSVGIWLLHTLRRL